MLGVLQEFIEKNIELIEQNNFKQLYKNCDNLEQRGNLTAILHRAGIPVLQNIGWSIPEFMFLKNNILEAHIPDNIRVIEQGAFLGCDQLEKVTIPSTVKMINFGAFKHCSKLHEIYYTGTSEELFNIHVDGYPFENPLEVFHCTDRDVSLVEYWTTHSAKDKLYDSID